MDSVCARELLQHLLDLLGLLCRSSCLVCGQRQQTIAQQVYQACRQRGRDAKLWSISLVQHYMAAWCPVGRLRRLEGERKTFCPDTEQESDVFSRCRFTCRATKLKMMKEQVWAKQSLEVITLFEPIKQRARDAFSKQTRLKTCDGPSKGFNDKLSDVTLEDFLSSDCLSELMDPLKQVGNLQILTGIVSQTCSRIAQHVVVLTVLHIGNVKVNFCSLHVLRWYSFGLLQPYFSARSSKNASQYVTAGRQQLWPDGFLLLSPCVRTKI